MTAVGNVYTGKSADGRTIFTLEVKSDATYTFKLIDQLDHADKTNPNDIINLNFGFKASDTDGDAANGTITIAVHDDGPVAVNDTGTLNEAPGSVTGNVLTNDDAGADEPGTVETITFGSTTLDVPASGTVTINGTHGTLTIAANGAYTYTGASVGADQFTYKMVDFDGDPATATLTVDVKDVDTCPIVTQNVSLKSPALAGTYSALVPGLGRIYSKDYTNGLLSFVFVASTAWQAYRRFKQNGISSFSGWIYSGFSTGFYLGNIYGSIKSAKKYNQKQFQSLDEKTKNYILNINF